MARTVRDHRLETRAQRERLAARQEPYWVLLSEGVHLGYYRGKKVAKWVARHRPVGRKGGYDKATLGEADDTADANSDTILTFAQAQEKARDWVKSQTGTKRDVADYTVADAIDDYLAGFAGKDVVNTKSRANKAKAALGHFKLWSLTSQQVKKYMTDIAAAPARLRTAKGKAQNVRALDSDDARRRRRSTTNRDMTVLKAALNLAFNDGYVSSDAAWKTVKPFKGADRAKLRYLTDDEARRLVNGTEGDFRSIVQASLLTGGRWGELRRVTVADLDTAAGTVWLRETKGSVPRVCYLEAEGLELFKQQSAGKLGTDLVFPRLDGKPWNDAQQTRRMVDACERGKIVPAATFHDLRRTYGARLALRGVPMAVIAEAMGHKDERITRKHYAHLAPSYVADTVRQHVAGLAIVQPSNVQRIA